MLGGRRREVAIGLAIFLAAGLTRFYQLGSPEQLIFDEVYYAPDACFYLRGAENACGRTSEYSWMHPPLGKWLIALGILLFGYDPGGWRIAAAAAGFLTVGLVYFLARRLTGSSWAAIIAAGILALDPLSIVSSRVAMLDVFTTCAGVAALTFAILDRDRLERAAGSRFEPWWRPWRAAAGLACGVAIATKWSGTFIVAGVIVLVLAWELTAADRAGRPRNEVLLRAGPSILLWLVAVPAAIYAASFVGRVDGNLLALPWQDDSWLRHFVRRQLDMASFHAGLDDTHPSASPAWSWLLGKRAVVYFFDVDVTGRYREVLAFANPVTWLAGAVAAGWAFTLTAGRRALLGSEVVIATAVAATYVPWLVFTIGRPFVFLHYVLPTIPFLALALGWASVQLPRRVGRTLGSLVGAIAVTAWLFWAPVMYALPLDYESWTKRIVFTDCTPEELTNGQFRPRSGGGPPPDGWCWV